MTTKKDAELAKQYELGFNAGKAEAQAKADLIQSVTDDNYVATTTSTIRATIAAVLEAVASRTEAELKQADDHGNTVLEVAVDLERQKTIWDRWEYTTTRAATNDNLILITMTCKVEVL